MGSGEDLPSFVPGRKGGLSVVDALARALWHESGVWPSRTIRELKDLISIMLRYDVPSSTVRSELYRHKDVFERKKSDGGPVTYQLTKTARRTRT